jgi:hypothetical protein
VTTRLRHVITRSAGHKYSYGDHGPFPGVTSIASLQDAVGGSDSLLNWAVNLALDEVERGASREEEWPVLRQRAFNAKNVARDIGSAVHVAVDAFNRGGDLIVDATTAPYLAHYGAFAHRHGLRVIGSERYVINTTIGFGGTYDLLAEVDGERALLDVKTGKAKPSQRLQLTGLSMGELHGEDGGPCEGMPVVETAYILLLRPDGYELVPHTVTDADREHFVALVETYHRVQNWIAQYTPNERKAA